MERRRLVNPAVVAAAVAVLASLPIGRVRAQETAKEILAAGLAEAGRTDRLVFLHSGAPWCGWCARLEHWLQRDDIAPIFSKDFVDVKIDVDSTPGGQRLMDAYSGGDQGVPWLAILLLFLILITYVPQISLFLPEFIDKLHGYK